MKTSDVYVHSCGCYSVRYDVIDFLKLNTAFNTFSVFLGDYSRHESMHSVCIISKYQNYYLGHTKMSMNVLGRLAFFHIYFSFLNFLP